MNEALHFLMETNEKWCEELVGVVEGVIGAKPNHRPTFDTKVP